MMTTTDPKATEEIQKYFAKIERNEDGSIPSNFPGLTFDEAVLLQILLTGCSESDAKIQIDGARNGRMRA